MWTHRQLSALLAFSFLMMTVAGVLAAAGEYSRRGTVVTWGALLVVFGVFGLAAAGVMATRARRR